MKLKSLLKNKNFLYFVLFIASVNTFGYLMMRQTEAVMLFALVGFLTTFFTKNMIIVLLTAIVVTNVYAGSVLGVRIKEGMESKSDEDEDEDEDEEDDEGKEGMDHEEGEKKKKGKKEGMPSLKPADVPPNGKIMGSLANGTAAADASLSRCSRAPPQPGQAASNSPDIPCANAASPRPRCARAVCLHASCWGGVRGGGRAAALTADGMQYDRRLCAQGRLWL